MRLEVGGTAERPVVERAGLLRTARLLFDGTVYRARALAAQASDAHGRRE